MKKLLTILMILFFSTVGIGQIRVGVKSGTVMFGSDYSYHFAFFSGSSQSSGSVAAISIEYPINHRWLITSALSYYRRNYVKLGVVDLSILGCFFGYKNYASQIVEIPVLVKFIGKGKTRLYTNAGPYFSYNLGGKLSIYANDTNRIGKIIFQEEPKNYEGDDFYVKGKLRRLDYGLYLGAGVQKDFKKIHSIFVDLQFGIGFRKLTTTPMYQIDKRKRNSNRIITLGYLVTIGKKKDDQTKTSQ